MPTGFFFTTRGSADTNTAGLEANCYYCTVAALTGLSTDDLVSKTETMQQDFATRSEIQDLFRLAGIPAFAFCKQGLNLARAGDNLWSDEPAIKDLMLSILSDGYACGLGYRRPDNTCHMVVAVCRGENIYCQDFQKGGRKLFPPENGCSYIVWLSTEMDDLSEQMANLKIND
jgi:hypothetical protein